MQPQIEIRRIDPQRVATIRATTVAKDISRTLAEILPEVGKYARDHGIRAAGPPFARYYVYEPHHVELDGGISILGDATGNGRVAIGELPGGEVAAGTHLGPYTSLRKTYESMTSWLREQNRQPAGAPWEVYVTDPGEEPDHNLWRTDIYQPVEWRMDDVANEKMVSV